MNITQRSRNLFVLSFGILFGLANPVHAQAPDTLWTRTFGGHLSDQANSVALTSDGGFVLAGQTFSFAQGASDAWLIRTGGDGETLWSKSYGVDAPVHEGAQSVAQTADGGFIMAGTVSAGTSAVLLIRTDADGEELWLKSYGGFDNDFGADVVEMPDGSFVVVGTTRSHHMGFGSSIWLIGTDASGEELWSKVYGGRSYQEGKAISLTSDGGLVVTGSYNNGGSQSADIWLLRADSGGDTLWTKTFGGEGTQTGYSVLQTLDGGFAAVSSYWDGASRITLIRTDEDGNELWSKTFEGSLQGSQALDETSDGGFIITGSTGGDLFLIRTDKNGDVLWTSSYGNNQGDQGNAVLQTADGGFVVAGIKGYAGGQTRDAWLLRLGPDGPPVVDLQIGEIARFENRRPLLGKLSSDAPADYVGDGIAEITGIEGDYDGDGIADLAVVQGCTLNLIDLTSGGGIWNFSWGETNMGKNSAVSNEGNPANDLSCVDGELAPDADIRLLGFIIFSGVNHALLEIDLDGGNRIIGVLIAALTREVAYQWEGRVVQAMKTPGGKPIVVLYHQADNAISVVGELTSAKSGIAWTTGTQATSLRANTPDLENKLEGEAGLHFAYDPDLFLNPGRSDMDGDGHPDIPMFVLSSNEVTGINVRGGDAFEGLWTFNLPGEYRDNISRHVHGFADIDGDGQKELIAGDNLIISMDGSVQSIAPDFVILDFYDVDGDGVVDIVGMDTLTNTVVVYGVDPQGTSVDDVALPGVHAVLFQNYPNPFRETTTIAYEIAVGGSVTLTVYDLLGRRLVTLLEAVHSPGRYQVEWDGRDGSGSHVATGTYFYRLRVNDHVSTKPVLRIR
jgi:hypothetical protein